MKLDTNEPRLLTGVAFQASESLIEAIRQGQRTMVVDDTIVLPEVAILEIEHTLHRIKKAHRKGACAGVQQELFDLLVYLVMTLEARKRFFDDKENPDDDKFKYTKMRTTKL